MSKLKRRSLLRLGALSGLASGLSAGGVSAAGAASSGVRDYVRLGRTEMKVADISFGSFPLQPGDEKVVHHALDLGINYFDTAEGLGWQIRGGYWPSPRRWGETGCIPGNQDFCGRPDLRNRNDEQA